MKSALVSNLLKATTVASVVFLSTPAFAGNTGAVDGPACAQVGTWLRPGSRTAVPAERILAEMAQRPIVLLGESHDNPEHHRWQLHTLAALYAHHPNIVIGFEMFPRRVQSALDAWVAGEHDIESFLDAAKWRDVWGFDEGLYLPLFHFARQNRLAMVALNVERQLVARVGREGWAAIPKAEREGVSDPAAASDAYRDSLAQVYIGKQASMREAASRRKGNQTHPHGLAHRQGAPTPESVVGSEDFRHFVEAQLTWDRAMAEALAAADRRHPSALVVGIIGQGHLEHRFGIPHQLAELGITDAAVLLPVEPEATCQELSADLADGVFVVARTQDIENLSARPTLGVFIETTNDGVRVTRVITGSVAEATKLAEGDVVTAAAGEPIARVSELIAVVQRQAPGTWLPLKVRRGGRELDIVAKFPNDSARSE